MTVHRSTVAFMSGSLALFGVAALVGCGMQTAAMTTSSSAATQKAPSDALDAKATIPFDQLDPLPPLAAASQPSAAPLQGAALRHYKAGLEATASGQYTDAIDEFEAAVKAAPDAFQPRLELGRAALQSGMFDQAQTALEAAVRLSPRDGRAHYLLGLLSHLRENDKAAVPQLRYALALFDRDGDRIKPLFYLTLALERQGCYQAAADAAARFEALLPAHPTGRYDDPRWRQVFATQAWKIPAARGNCLRRLGHLHAAVAAYDAALKLDPDRPEIQLALATTLVDLGDTSRTVQLAESVLAKDRHNSDALAVLAATLVSQNRMDELQDRLLAMVRAKPSDLLVVQRVTTVLLKFDRQDAALDCAFAGL